MNPGREGFSLSALSQSVGRAGRPLHNAPSVGSGLCLPDPASRVNEYKDLTRGPSS